MNSSYINTTYKKYIDHSGLDFKQYQLDGVVWCVNNEKSLIGNGSQDFGNGSQDFGNGSQDFGGGFIHKYIKLLDIKQLCIMDNRRRKLT